MVRTGARAAALERLLTEGGLKAAPIPRSPRLVDLPDHRANDVLKLYWDLGGLEESPTLRPGSWDLSFEGNLVVELDEELHFNRYRATTLCSPWSAGLPWTRDYLTQCAAGERRCLAAGKWGKRWTNAAAARMFSGGEPGDLAAGSPRWKQRAMYDAIKDAVASLDAGPRLARISIYDEIDGVQVEDVLTGPAPTDPAMVVGFIDQRSAG